MPHELGDALTRIFSFKFSFFFYSIRSNGCNAWKIYFDHYGIDMNYILGKTHTQIHIGVSLFPTLEGFAVSQCSCHIVSMYCPSPCFTADIYETILQLQGFFLLWKNKFKNKIINRMDG